MSAPFTLSLLLTALCLLHTGLAQQCPEDGYEVFPAVNGSRYKLALFPLKWEEAKLQCQSDGGGSNLVVINSDTEAEVVKTLVTRLIAIGSPVAWVGISDLVNEAVWRTVHGGLVSESGYNKWLAGYPNGGSTANCGLASITALYYDNPCSNVRPFICEKPDV